MKNKIVLWGTNAQEERVLLALELQAEKNKVDVFVFPQTIVNDEFSAKMTSDWREGKEVDFPEGHQHIVQDLSVAESLLPADIKVERTDLIQRAQSEWHFVVLSNKLHKLYEQELNEFKEKVGALKEYDNTMWLSLKGFWDKVQEQAKDRNLIRDHVNILRDNINVLFGDLKELKNKVNQDFADASEQYFNEFNKSLDAIDDKINNNSGKFAAIFDELKRLQRSYAEAKLTGTHRSKLWERLDSTFKRSKEKQFGKESEGGSQVDRLEKRLNGLYAAMDRMSESLRRDKAEFDYQKKNIERSEGQLEAQLRHAKIKMVEERVISKQEKLDDMVKTQEQLEKQLEQAKAKEPKRTEKPAAAEATASTASNFSAKSATAAPKAEPKNESILDAINNVLGESFENMVDSVKAVAGLVAEKAEDFAQDAVKEATEMVDNLLEKAEPAKTETVEVVEVKPEVVEVKSEVVEVEPKATTTVTSVVEAAEPTVIAPTKSTIVVTRSTEESTTTVSGPTSSIVVTYKTEEAEEPKA